ncbi:MAG TPA: TonB-dependent receptor [Candidatus Acidoferrales bacterium]|nr:TonB-dependent receptor [Candidatus Acidoferrales bacterium]
MTYFRRRVSAFLSALAILVLIGTGNAYAQARKGTITGQVTDVSGAVLKGAKVTLEPSGATVVSDVNGNFFVNGLDPGTYTMTVTYVGFTAFRKTVDLTAGQNATLNAQLAPETQSLSVLVTAPRPSAEAAAVNEQRSADNIVQVLPADVIRSLPNANMADALGRLPGVTLERDEGEGKYVQIRGTEPRLTNTTIDGMNVPSPESGVRQIKFDSIPADIVESVEINKTLQANMDGDGIGGSVNLVTKTAENRPIASLSEMGGYTPIDTGRGLTETAGTVGKRFGAQKRFGTLIGGSYDWNGRGIDDIEPVPDIATLPSGATQRYFDSIDVRQYVYYRSRWGLAGSTDYRLGDGSDIYVRGLYSDFKNYGDRTVYTLNDNTPNIGLLNGNGGTPSFNTQIRRPDINIGTLAIGGTHALASTVITWEGNVSRSSDNSRNDGTAKFDSTLGTSSCEYDPAATTHVYLPQWTPSCYTEAYNTADYSMSKIQISHGHTAQVNLQGGASLAKRYNIGSHAATIEVGGKFRNAHKFDDTYSVTLKPKSTVLLSQFPSRFTNDNFYSGDYAAGPNPHYQDMIAFADANPGAFSSSSTQFIDPGNYDLDEKVSAGYVMNTIDLSRRLRLVAGIRFEGTNLSTMSFDTVANTLSDRANGSYVSILPSASLRVGFKQNDDVRFVYSRGVSRPDPQDIAQAETYDDTTTPFSASLGNANLKAEMADNVDVLYEHYFNSFGMFSAGWFYKNLTDPIVTTTIRTPNYQPPIQGAPQGTYDVTQPVNAGSAWLTGFEASYIQRFSMFPGPLRGLGISANYGYTASRTSGIPGRSDHPRLLRNAPNTWNISPTYDMGRFSIRVGLSYNEANIYSYNYADGTPGGLQGPLGDTYFYSHLQVDAQGSIRLTHGLNFVMYGLNLTNEVFGFYQGSPQFMIQREYYTPTIAAGIRWNLQSE